MQLNLQVEVASKKDDIDRIKCSTNTTNYRLINQKCVYYETQGYNYEDAKQNCKTKFDGNGRLFEPTTWNENEIAYKIGKQLGNKNWRIGINDEQSEGHFSYESTGARI